MNNEAIVQALIRGGRVFIVAGLVALGLDLGAIVEIGTGGDVLYGPLIFAVATAVIEAILKAVGGPTEPATPVAGRTAASSANRPNPLSI